MKPLSNLNPLQMSEQPTRSQERQALVELIQAGRLRQQTAVEMMKVLERIPSEFNDLPVYPTEQSKLQPDMAVGSPEDYDLPTQILL